MYFLYVISLFVLASAWFISCRGELCPSHVLIHRVWFAFGVPERPLDCCSVRRWQEALTVYPRTNKQNQKKKRKVDPPTHQVMHLFTHSTMKGFYLAHTEQDNRSNHIQRRSCFCKCDGFHAIISFFYCVCMGLLLHININSGTRMH